MKIWMSLYTLQKMKLAMKLSTFMLNNWKHTSFRLFISIWNWHVLHVEPREIVPSTYTFNIGVKSKEVAVFILRNCEQNNGSAEKFRCIDKQSQK